MFLPPEFGHMGLFLNYLSSHFLERLDLLNTGELVGGAEPIEIMEDRLEVNNFCFLLFAENTEELTCRPHWLAFKFKKL